MAMKTSSGNWIHTQEQTVHSHNLCFREQPNSISKAPVGSVVKLYCTVQLSCLAVIYELNFLS